jgi:hypothetical protein
MCDLHWTPTLTFQTITTAMYARNVSQFEQSWLTDLPPFKQAAKANGST